MSIHSSVLVARNGIAQASCRAESGTRAQRLRRLTQLTFFALFVLAPVFDLLRFDLLRGHAYVFGIEWHLGFDELFARQIGAREVGGNIFLRLFLPAFGTSILLLAVAWRWGRIYCGWACPHFALVELLNPLVARATGKPGVWERKRLPGRIGRAVWWLPTVLLASGIAGVWAVALLTYVLPPSEVYPGLLGGTLGRVPTLFIAVVTVLLTLEFLFVRDLFCRYGCSVGLFQSLAWLMNRDALVVGFDRTRAASCADCYAPQGPGDAACEIACPLRLRPRVPKQAMYACTQCGRCLDACATVQHRPLLGWVSHEAARANEARMALLDRVF